jgi:uncharacterized protein
MSNSAAPARWGPTDHEERHAALDVVRGLALFGVLLMNLLTVFRVSLFQHILTFHTHPGLANRLVDDLAAGLIEFKAFGVFSLLFGVGARIQAERAAARGVAVSPFLVRRFLVLLGLGLAHMLLIWNGDILALYAVCGLLLVPLIRLPAGLLAALGVAAVAANSLLPLGPLFPSAMALRDHAERATRVYAEGGFGEILVFRCREAWRFILPLLIGSLPRTFGLMLLGAAAWRAGVLREPARHRVLLWAVALVGGSVGGTATALQVAATSADRPPAAPAVLLEALSSVPLALAYAAALFLWLIPPRTIPLAGALADVGRTALSNYVAQSVVLGFVFYGYGLGLFGRLGPAAALPIGLALYAAQLGLSRAWLRRYRFGPLEWLWRSLSYGRPQPLRRAKPAVVS